MQVWRTQDRSKRKDRNKGKVGAINKKTYLHAPVNYAKTLKRDFVRGTWTCQKEERGIPVVERRRKKMGGCALVAMQ